MDMSLEELAEIVSACLDEIVKLKAEKEELQRQTEALSKENQTIIEIQKATVDRLGQAFTNMNTLRHVSNCGLDNLKYELGAAKELGDDFYYPKFYDLEETLRLLTEEKKSMARFGDGEFSAMANEKRHKFQHPDERLAKRLQEVIASEDENLLIGIADNYGSLAEYNEAGKQGIRMYMTAETRKMHRQYLDLERTYHNAYISRPYVIYADNLTDAPAKRFEKLRKIWENRNVVIVEGSLSGIGVGNDLLKGAASVRRIEAPPEHSFDKYDEILEAALRLGRKDDLFLIALGPSAGVLAYDLTKEGYQAIDIGHIDMEYEWFLNGTGERCEVKNKYNNEMMGGECVEPIRDEAYQREIICRI